MPAHLYFHIPFCAKLCPYCSFYVDTHFKNKSRRFLDALLAEVDLRARSLCDHGQDSRLKPRTLYFGGGTPSSLSLGELEYLLGALRDRLDLSALEEWTFEINPATVSLDKARLLRQFGVNRISMGVQSWEDPILKVLGRIHSAAQAQETLEILRRAGFDNLSIDLMFAVPTQTRSQWKATLEKTIALAPRHVSAYCLTYEEDTAFYEKLKANQFTQDPDWDADLFEMTMDLLGAAGYLQYEISNYALPGWESRHNLAYWNGDDYFGFGPGAFSTLGEERWQNLSDTAAYTAQMLAGENVVAFQESVSPETRRGERIAFSLRTLQGIEAGLLEPWQKEIEEFLELGLLENRGTHLALTRKGRLLADSVAEIFVGAAPRE
jgi:oxygen-independent coproporphyrinogen-3 oxidase